MYQSFYGLTDKPFQLNPDPSFYFGSREHRRAMAYLEYGLHQNEGFIVVTGDVGTGKTTLIRSLVTKLDSKRVISAQLVSTQLDAEDTLRLVCAAFGLPAKDIEKSDALLSLEKLLRSLARDGKRALLIIDEAQNLTPGPSKNSGCCRTSKLVPARSYRNPRGPTRIPRDDVQSTHAAAAPAGDRFVSYRSTFD